MSKTWKSVISLLLVFVFTLQLMPFSSLAVEAEESISNEEAIVEEPDQAQVELADTESVESYIVGEDNDLREESAKHFRMNDGTYMAVDYGMPVHYKTALGKWQNIDNTLRKMGSRYCSVNGEVRKEFSDSLASGQLFDLSYQDYRIGMALVVDEDSYSSIVPDTVTNTPEPEVPTEDTTDSEADESELVEEATEKPETEPEESAVASETQAVEETPETAVPQAAPTPAPSAAVETADDGTRYLRVQEESVSAEVENPVKTEKIAGEASNEEMIALETQYSKIQYSGALKNTDLSYTNCGYNVKESITVHEKQVSYVYSFSLSLTGLSPVMQEDGSILLNGRDDQPVFEIPAPYMIDARGDVSSQVSYDLKTTDAGFVLVVSADSEWINSEECMLPVVIDPTIIVYNNGGVKTAMIRSLAPNSTSPNFADQFCGYRNNSSYGTCEVVLQVESMPTLPKNCVVVNAAVMMYQWSFYTSDFSSATTGSLIVDVHKLNNPVSSVNTTTYNDVHNTAGVDATILDYQTLTSSTTATYLTWDVTSAALGWISTGATKGALLLTPNPDQTINRFCNLIGHGYGSYSPYFVVQYRNTVGIEDYFTYEEASAGRAGNVYVEDFSNKMTVERPIVSLNLAPVNFAITHYFNSGYSGNYFSYSYSAPITCNYSNMIVGAGWKLSVQQTVVEKVIGMDTYLVYTDADGTQHFFAKAGSSSTTFKDEDGLGLTIVKSTSGSNTIYTMTDIDAYSTWVFHNGYLISQTDHNGNAIYIAYNNNYSSSGTSWKPNANSTNRIVQVVQHTDSSSAPYITVATFTYNSSNFLTKITDYANRSTTFTYSGSLLTTITDPDGNTSVYEYSSDSNLIGAYDSEAKCGLDIEYTYSTYYGTHTWTVTRVSEYAKPSSTKLYGNRFHLYRENPQLTAVRYYGADHIDDSQSSSPAGDDLVVYNAFDYYGRTITSYTTNWTKEKLLGVSAGAYKANSNTNPEANNRLSKTASSGQHVENMILDSGLEYNLAGWEKKGSSTNTDDINAVVGTNYYYYYGHYQGYVYPHAGEKQLKIYMGGSTTLGSGYCYLRKQVTLESGKTYTFSGYINTSTMTSFDSDPSHGSYLAVMNSAGSTVYAKSEVINYFTEPTVEGGWERVSFTFTPTSTGTYYLSACQSGVLGITAFDDIQLELGDTMSSVNLIQNGSFETYSGSTYWQSPNIVNHPGGGLPTGAKTLKITGSPTATNRVSQTVNINLDAKTTFLLSGWGKASSVFFATKDENTSYDRFFGLIAVITYTDNATETQYVPFSAAYAGWQYASGVIAPKQTNKTIKTITVSCAYDKNANDAYFDNISLIREPAQTYTYDSKGNPVSATNDKAMTAYEYYSGTSKLKNYTTPSGTKYSFTYQSGTNNVATETLHNVITTNSYNSSGDITTQVTRLGSSGIFQKATQGYDATQNHKTSATDVNGVASTFGYNTTYHLMTSSKTGTLPTQVYNYNTANGRMSSTYYSGYDAIDYAYSYGRLNYLTRKTFTTVGGSTPFWQKYSLAYDSFGNNTSVSVSGATTENSFSAEKKLVNYTYETSVNGSSVNNGRLKQMTYANGNTVTYDYDLFDRTTSETYNNGTVYRYYYDAEGNLSRQEATVSNNKTEQYVYDYDSLGRLIHSKKLDGSNNTVLRTEHQYDTSNRLTKQSWTYSNGITCTSNYTYSDGSNGDGTLTSVESYLPIGSYSLPPYHTVTYSYNNLRQLTRKTTGTLFYRAYAYQSGSETSQITNLVQYMNYRRQNNDALIKGYKYIYNSDGNISAIYHSTDENISSTPDQTYTYDALGQLSKVVDNIAGRTYNYSYDTAGNIRTMTGAASGNVTLTYGDTIWKDRLTKVQVGNSSENITYETASNGYISGNPTSYYNGRHYNFTWKQGRQLATATVNSVTTSYNYDMAGVRSSKTVGSTTYNYDTLSGLVIRQTWDNGQKELFFLYDDNNQPYFVAYRSSPTATPLYYHYVLNLQGDVVAIMNCWGNIVCQYTYDPWGAVTVGTDTSACGIGSLNPLRYRGYYYDTDTGLYYLQSRYYDPAIGRFINADTFATTDANGFLSCNMFAYCENNPIMKNDLDGSCSVLALVTATSAAVGLIVGATSQMISNRVYGKPLWEGVLGAALGGATYNAVSVLTRGNTVAAGYAAAFVESVTSEMSSYLKGEKQLNKKNAFISLATVSGKTLAYGTVYAATGKLVDKRIPVKYSKMINSSTTFKDLGNIVKNTGTQAAGYQASRFLVKTMLS